MSLFIQGYTLNAKIAEGACAEIYAAVDQSSGRQVAIKALHPRHLANKEEYRRLHDEGALGAKLEQHDNIAQVYKFGMAGNIPYIVLEYVKGTTLRELLGTRKMLINWEILSIAKGLCRGLRFIHNAGICHKDLKPDNIMINDEGVVKLIDFGFAENTKSFSLFGKGLTGSPPYMAPELFSSKKPTPGTDIYALGCTLYEAASGMQPFGGMSDGEVIAKQKNMGFVPAPVATLNKGISSFTEKTIMTAIEKNISRRFKSVDEILLDLARNPALRGARQSQSLPIVRGP